MELKQYQIVLVNLDPTIGSEMKKTRQCVIISPDEMNRHIQTIVIAPMTSISKNYPTRIAVTHNNTKGWIVVDQLRTVDRQRAIRILGELSNSEIQKVKKIIRETYVD